MDSRFGDVTRNLSAARAGEPRALERLLDLVYEPLRALAGKHFRAQPASHTLQPTALVHEVYLRVIGREGVDWQDRAHFFAVCSRAMRGILVDHARRVSAAKRGGEQGRVTLDDVIAADATESHAAIDLLDLEEHLVHLATLNERHARIVECRFFAGMTIPEVALALDVSERTVSDDWAMARAWLGARLERGGGP